MPVVVVVPRDVANRSNGRRANGASVSRGKTEFFSSLFWYVGC